VAADKLGTCAPHRVAALDEVNSAVAEHDAPTQAELEGPKHLKIHIEVVSPPT
jgi:hypothetical protein